MAKTAGSWKQMKSMQGKRDGRAGVAAAARSVARAISVAGRRSAGVRRGTKYRRQVDSGTEVKFLDTTIGSVLEDATGAVSVLVNGVVQGTDNNQRIGRKFKMTSVQYKLVVSATTTQLGTANYSGQSDCIRVALVYDSQANGNGPTTTQVWTVAGTNIDVFAARNLDYIERYTVLAEDLVNINAAGSTAQIINRFLRCELPVRNDGTGATIADIETGSLYLIAFDQNNAATNQATITGRVRMQFVDL